MRVLIRKIFFLEVRKEWNEICDMLRLFVFLFFTDCFDQLCHVTLFCRVDSKSLKYIKI